MKSFKISLWERYFENGVSQVMYQRIGRFIREYGMNVIVQCTPDTDDSEIELLESMRKHQRKNKPKDELYRMV